MRIEDMSKNQKLILFVVLSGAWIGALVYWNGKSNSEEQTVVARLRKAKKLNVEVKLQRGKTDLIELTGDREPLIQSFHILEKGANSGAKISACIFDLDDVDNEAIVYLFPPNLANVGGTLYKIDPAFWTALVERAPKVQEFLEKKSPNDVPANPRKPIPKNSPSA